MRYAFAAILSTLLSIGNANAEVKLGAYAIPGVLEANKSGDYDKLLARIATLSGKAIHYAVLPPARAEDGLKSGALDCVIPLDRRFWPGKENLVNSEPLNVAKIYLFSRPGEGPYTSLDQLKGKKIGVRRGMPYGPKLGANIHTEAVSDDDQNVQKLKEKRIDAFLAYVPDMWFWAKDKKASLPNYKADTPFDIHRDAFLCRDSKEVQEFLQFFNAAVKQARESGELKRMLGDAFVP